MLLFSALSVIKDDASYSAQLSDRSVNEPSIKMEKLKLWLPSASVWKLNRS